MIEEAHALNQLTRRHTNATDDFEAGSNGDSRWSYDYDDNGNLEQAKQEKYLSGSWTETLRWEYDWDVHDNLIEAQKYEGNPIAYAGKVEYRYSPVIGSGRTERIQYDASNAIESWIRYEIDGLRVLRTDERYDSDTDGIDSSDPWRMKSRSTHGPGVVGSLLFKEVFSYPNAHNKTGVGSKVYYYGYDAQGNVSVVTEEYCGGSAEAFVFTQDAFGNELDHGLFDRSDWEKAAVGRFAFLELSSSLPNRFRPQDPIEWVPPWGRNEVPSR